MPKESIIGLVKRNLWSNGYSVKTPIVETDFDLLVEGKRRVVVLDDIPRSKTFPAHPGIVYAMAGVMFGQASVVFFEGENPKDTKTCREMFGLPKSKDKNHGNKRKGNRAEA